MTIKYTLAFVFLAAITWEIFEIAAGILTFEDNNYVGDTILDIIMGVVGGMAGYFVGKRVSQLDYD